MISTETGGIGMNQRLPWDQLSILKDNFNDLAKDQVVLLGKNTYENFAHFHGEKTYVYTTQEDFEETDLVKKVSGDSSEIISRIKTENPDKNIIVLGGKTVFDNFFDYIDEWRITIIHGLTVFNQDVSLGRIYQTFKRKVLINTGTDFNQEFTTYHFYKE
jgi:dihydrofolate reductase